MTALKNIFHSLAFRLALSLIALILFPMFLISHLIYARYDTFLKDQISQKVIESISKSEDSIYRIFQQIATISSNVIVDSRLQNIISDPRNVYNNSLLFNDISQSTLSSSPLSDSSVFMTLLCRDRLIYSNWSFNYNDYTFLFDLSLVTKSMESDGYAVWGISSGADIFPHVSSAAKKKYIMLSRSIFSPASHNSLVGTLLVCVDVECLQSALQQYSYSENDLIFVCLADGTILSQNSLAADYPSDSFQEDIMHALDSGKGSFLTAASPHYLVSYYTVKHPWTVADSPLTILHYTNYEDIIRQVRQFTVSIDIISCTVAILLCAICIALSFYVVRPIIVLSKEMQNFSVLHPVKTFTSEKRKDEIGEIYKSYKKMALQMQKDFEIKEEQHKTCQLYRFKALRAQVNPHFLFNTLTMIRWMSAAMHAENITNSIIALSDLLHFSMDKHGEYVTVQEEMNSLSSYILIQNYRFGGSYNIELDIAPCTEALYMIKFLIQPAIENAIIHAFPYKKGTIHISTRMDSHKLHIFVSDDGQGIADTALKEIFSSGAAKGERLTGIGLPVIQERICSEYGSDYGLSVYRNVNTPGTTVEYILPVIEKDGLLEHNDYDC